MLLDDRSIGELWGWEKDAFTGATKRFDGQIEKARGGTLFFDEIGNAPPTVQKNLLRLLQEKKFRRAGSNQDEEANVRIIAATNQDLRKELDHGFRRDLFDRLAVYVIQIPPLNERRDDIIPNARQVWRTFNSRWANEIQAAGGVLKSLGRDAERELRLYDWPGNVRELQHVITRLVIQTLGRDEEISAQDVRRELNAWSVPRTDGLTAEPIGEGFSLDECLNRIKFHYVSEAKRLAGGNKSKITKLLGFSNRTPLNTILANLAKSGFDIGELDG